MNEAVSTSLISNCILNVLMKPIMFKDPFPEPIKAASSPVIADVTVSAVHWV